MSTQNLNTLADRLIDLCEVMHLTSLKKTKIYELIKSGEIHSIKIGSKTVFSELEIQSWIAAYVAQSKKSRRVAQ